MNDTTKYAIMLNRIDAVIRIIHTLKTSEREKLDFELGKLASIEILVERLLADESPYDALEDIFHKILEAVSDQIPTERKRAMLEKCKYQLFDRIAEDHLEIDSLESHNPEDRLCIHIWRIKDALNAAFDAGKESGDFEKLIDKGGDDD